MVILCFMGCEYTFNSSFFLFCLSGDDKCVCAGQKVHWKDRSCSQNNSPKWLETILKTYFTLGIANTTFLIL